ncbi:hypothetical protein HZY62_13455 [Maribacter polysiphoniae]|uniref:Endosialidase-like protein n=1 Tax=Maribacter polysiphoniae TaxID=429344 RepID=A0A316DYT9_9FLAO|nr:tail fiber protein [Maribacter polysiphoniae]MBD1261605.1 hypothetical protein [Maribacter polysiphoniae]PWK22598.1 hypothetical protein LX92_03073 [Maribacter polysiphoniae]
MKNLLLLITILFFGLDSQAQYSYNGSDKHTFTTTHGKLEIGPWNSSFGHIYTDRPKIIFNKPVYTTANTFSSYDNDLILQTEGNTRMVINDDTGRVGIGTSTPTNPLHITSTGRTGVRIGGPNNSSGAIADLIFSPVDAGIVGNSKYWYLSFRTDYWANTPGDLVFYSHNGASYTSPLILQSDGDVALVTGKGAARNGNVGIGTLSPDSKLTVKGKIHAEEIKVDLSVPAPDYVFKDDYNLRSLEETQIYIKENGHLPNIPTAKEMEENGVELGVMNMKLLEKIEELTLYTLEQQNRIRKLEKELDQKEQINLLFEERLHKIETSHKQD